MAKGSVCSERNQSSECGMHALSINMGCECVKWNQ